MKSVFIIILLNLFFVFFAEAQVVKVTAEIEKDTIEYADTVILTLKAIVPNGKNITFPKIENPILEELEIIEKSDIEIYNDSLNTVFQQQIKIIRN